MAYSQEHSFPIVFCAAGAPVTAQFMYPGWVAMTANEVQITMPVKCRLANMSGNHRVAAGGGLAVAYTVRVNAVASAATITITDPATEAEWEGQVDIAANDEISVTAVSANVGATVDVTVALRFLIWM